MYVLRKRRCFLSFERKLIRGHGSVAFLAKCKALVVYNKENELEY